MRYGNEQCRLPSCTPRYWCPQARWTSSHQAQVHAGLWDRGRSEVAHNLPLCLSKELEPTRKTPILFTFLIILQKDYKKVYFIIQKTILTLKFFKLQPLDKTWENFTKYYHDFLLCRLCPNLKIATTVHGPTWGISWVLPPPKQDWNLGRQVLPSTVIFLDTRQHSRSLRWDWARSTGARERGGEGTQREKTG